MDRHVIYVAEQPTIDNPHGQVRIAPVYGGQMRISVSASGRAWMVDPTQESVTLFDLDAVAAKLLRYQNIATPELWTPAMLSAWAKNAPDLEKRWAALRKIAEGS